MVKKLSMAVVGATFSTFILTVSKADAAVIVLDFEGLQNLEEIQDYYNGGVGSLGSGPGPNFGVTFSDNSLAIIKNTAGGSGNFGGTPSGDTIAFFLSGTANIMNVINGFDTGFSFFYSAVNNPGFVEVYDDIDGTGNLLASIGLPLTPDGSSDPACDFNNFCPFVPIGVAFSGIAKSVNFGGSANQIGFDDITLGSATPGNGNGRTVPEPTSTLSLLALGTLGAVSTLKRKLKSKSPETQTI